jgi:hypothetical protein
MASARLELDRLTSPSSKRIDDSMSIVFAILCCCGF